MSENIITIDGRDLEFSQGETILDVARRNDIFIPTLCHLKGTTPTGACRICVVEIEGGRGLSPACAMPASAGAIVHTSSETVLEARRTILALLLQSGNHNCAIGSRDPANWTQIQEQAGHYEQTDELCPVYGECKLQAFAYRYQVDPAELVRLEAEYPMEMASPLIIRDFSRCILCGRCVEACNVIQVNNAISHGFRGKRAKIVAMGDSPIERSDCVFCGQCIQACPVGALVEKKSLYKIRPWEARHVRTTCYYCGVGCQMDLHIKNDRIMKVSGAEEAFPNMGRLCVKGRFGFDFVQSQERLKTPMIRKDGKLREASWDEALEVIASKIKETIVNDGPEAIAGISSSKSTNESLYLMQKFFRAGIGSNNILSLYAGSGLNSPMANLERAGKIFLVSCDVTEENPVAGTFIKRAAKMGCHMAVVDSRATKIGEFAQPCFQIKEGTEPVLINGIINRLLAKGKKASEEVKETASNYPPSDVTGITGLSEKDLDDLVEFLGTDDPIMVVYGSRAGPAAKALIELQEILGNLYDEFGGVNFLGESNNSQGACDMGVHPEYLPGYAPVDDDDARKRFEKAWECTLNNKRGLSLGEIINGMKKNRGANTPKISILYLEGENLSVAGSGIPGLENALESVDFLIVQDILDHETVQYAHVVLPAAAWAEENGTYTNSERRISRVRKAVSPPGQAMPETWILTSLANRLDLQWPEYTSQEIWEKEILLLAPQLKDMTYESIDNGGIRWPISVMEERESAVSNRETIPLCVPVPVALNYHQRNLLEQCEGLIESLSHTGGIGTRIPPSEKDEVVRGFVKLLEQEGQTEAKPKIDEILSSYRGRMGGLIPVLQQVQEVLGFLPIAAQNYIALGLGVPASDVFGVVTFYSFFTMVPRGRHIIRTCLGTACFVKGSGKILDTLQRHLKLSVGETTEDREYSLEVVRCIGACGLAPVMVVDENTHGQVMENQVVDIVEGYRGL